MHATQYNNSKMNQRLGSVVLTRIYEKYKISINIGNITFTCMRTVLYSDGWADFTKSGNKPR